MRDGKRSRSGMNQRFQSVGELRVDNRAESSFAVESPKPAGGVLNGGSRSLADNPTAELLQLLFGSRKVIDGIDITGANNEVGFSPQNGLDERRDVSAKVLIVRIGVDNNVGTALQTGV